MHKLLFFFMTWYFWTIITYGTNVPAGLFLPGMILGCCIGNLAGNAADKIGYIDDDELENTIKNYVVLGTAAMLAGYTRMTYSLAIIMMETA